MKNPISSRWPFLISLISLLITSATAAEIESNVLGCLDQSISAQSSNEPVDLFPDKVVATHSMYWNITYHGTYKILNNTHSGVTYLLYQCGTDPPSNAEQDHLVVVPVPLQNGLALTQTTHIPHVELLGKRTDIKAYIGDPQYISSSCLKELINETKVEIIGSEDEQAISAWLEGHNDAIIVGHPWSDQGQSNLIIVSESQEKNNKAIFEWHKVYASFFNLEKTANEIFDEMEQRYDCVTENAAILTKNVEKPKVVWAFYSSYAKGWDVGSCPNYYCEYAEHCSAELLHSDEGSIVTSWGAFMTDEEFEAHAKDADVWVFPSNDWHATYKAYKNMLDRFVSVQNRQVFDTQGSGQYSWFEQRMAEYDVVLQDFCAMLNVTTNDPVHVRKWLSNVFTEPIGQLRPCDDVDASLFTRATECTALGSSSGQKISFASSSIVFFLSLAGAVLLLF